MASQGKNAVTAISRVVKEETAAALTGKLTNNVWATPSRLSPNGEKLKDGAIQRASVSVQGDALRFVKANPDGIGFYKREELNTKASSGYCWSSPWDKQDNRYRVARIYMPQRKHVHCHPTNKTDGTYWAIDFGNWGMHKSPLMGWKSGTQDVYHNMQMSFGRLSDAVAYAETMGWGFDIEHPSHRWHSKKNYADNFKYKGPPKEREDYD